MPPAARLAALLVVVSLCRFSRRTSPAPSPALSHMYPPRGGAELSATHPECVRGPDFISYVLNCTPAAARFPVAAPVPQQCQRRQGLVRAGGCKGAHYEARVARV